MLTFNNLNEMKPYYNKKTGNYFFKDDIEIAFNLNIQTTIIAKSIRAKNIYAFKIIAESIDASNMNVFIIDILNIDSFNIIAHTIRAENIEANDIIAEYIDAKNISFYTCCIAYKSLKYNSIKGRRKNSFYKCLDGETVISNE